MDSKRLPRKIINIGKGLKKKRGRPQKTQRIEELGKRRGKTLSDMRMLARDRKKMETVDCRINTQIQRSEIGKWIREEEGANLQHSPFRQIHKNSVIFFL